MTNELKKCPVEPMMRLISSRWTLYLMWRLYTDGKSRFGALQRALPGISAKMLAERLNGLQKAGVVHREVVPTVPPQVYYSLTPEGQELKRALASLEAVALNWDRRGWRPASGFPAGQETDGTSAEPATT